MSLCFNIILECPHGWIDANHKNLGCLYFEKDKSMPWNDAKNYCESLEYENSHLIEIYDSTQQKFLKEMLLNFDNSLTWWIGLTDSEIEGTWKWDFSGNISTYLPWGIDEPNGGGQENCATLDFSIKDGWSDYGCSLECSCCIYPICQFDL